ncbi:DoxX family protein [Nonomuraea sp. NPDC049649]|uniref:DoxX family protein n=1 Tax=Nonomuraea sp. NPDC049649 TaxID=3155776 RepID=UPI003438A33F
MEETDVALLVIRVCVGLTLVAHGLNHAFGGGKIAGTARWFEGLGLRPGVVHAWSSVLAEVAAGLGLVFGLLTPLACAAGIGVMTVAGVISHRRNGFFVFKDGYEYVLMIAMMCAAVALAGPGAASIDHALGLELAGVTGLAVAVGLGLVGAGLLLALAWRPTPPEVSEGNK